jgi:hypothetical protein
MRLLISSEDEMSMETNDSEGERMREEKYRT